MLMARGAATVVKTCLGVKKGERILIVTEPEKMNIAKAVAQAVYGEYAEPTLIIMLPRDRDGQEPPESVAEAMKKSDGFISIVGRSITHTHAVKDACQAGSRGIMLTQFSEDMMIHGGLEADFPQSARDCKAVAKKLGGAKKIRLTTAAGTDLTYSAVGRRYNAMYCMVEPGEFAPVPTVEANVSPLEGKRHHRCGCQHSLYKHWTAGTTGNMSCGERKDYFHRRWSSGQASGRGSEI